MKKIFIIGLLSLMAGSLFGQTSTELDKEQQKKVKEITKQAEKQNSDILNNQNLTPDEKRSRIDAAKSKRDAQLSEVLSPEQADAVKAKDPVNWNKATGSVDKQEKAQLKAERDQKLKDIDKQDRDLKSQQDDVKKQIDNLKNKQTDLKDQQKALSQKRKDIKNQYK